MNKISIFILSYFIGFSSLFSQTVVSPVEGSILLSGNFGELRTNHFHSGIDFKIGGVIGMPIKSVMEGYVSRISVSPWGYGRALYIDHPNGTTTVYGHLDHFAGEIETFVVDSQYVKQVFGLNIYPPKDLLKVKKGEVVGYGGNTGGSGGPHLHFEIRETESEDILDPIPAFMTKIKDNRAPKIQSLMAYPQTGKGIINGSTSKQIISIKKNKSGGESVEAIQAWGEIGFGVKAYDYMDGTSNIYGVRDVSLSVDGEEIFKYEMNKFGFYETRYLNSFVDWEEWTYKKSFYMKSFIDPGNLLRALQAKDGGMINIEEERIYKLCYTLKDLYGNTEILNFEVEGKKQDLPHYKPFGTLFTYSKDNEISRDGIDLKIPKGNLYTDIYFSYSMKKNYTPYSPLYNLHKRMPLHSYCPIQITIENDAFPDKSKYGIIFVDRNKRSWVGGKYEEGKISAEVRELGNYSVAIDTTPPVITEQTPASWGKSRKISFKVRDNLSGISAWSATLGGEFVLFEFDAKTATLFCKYDSKRMKSGTHELKLWVEDGRSNRSEYKKTITW